MTNETKSAPRSVAALPLSADITSGRGAFYSPRMNYSEQRKDPRWQKKRLEVLQAANWRCEDCNCADRTLEVHHTAYKTGALPWEYPSELLMAVCDQCHDTRQNREDAIRIAIGKITRFMTIAEIEKEVWEMVEQMSVRQTARFAEAFTA